MIASLLVYLSVYICSYMLLDFYITVYLFAQTSVFFVYFVVYTLIYQFFACTFSGRGKLTFGKQNYIGNFHDDKMIGPGTYIFANGTQQHGEYIVVEEELEDLEVPKGKNDSENDNRSRTKQVKIKWISRNGDAPPVTVVKKETVIN